MLLTLVVLLAASSPAAHANSILFSTGPTVVGVREVDVTAQFDFDVSARTITISLVNAEANPIDVTQLLGSLRFTLSGAGASPVPTITQVNGSTFGVDSGGDPITNVKAIAWTASNIGGTQIALCTVCSAGGNQGLLIGGPDVNGIYTSANGSIAGNNGHNPFIIASDASYTSGVLHGLDTSPSWTMSVPTETANVAVSKVIFGFGTGTNYGTNTIQVDTFENLDAPEPASKITILAGLGLILIGARKYRPR